MRTFNRLQSFARENRRNPTRHEDMLYSAILSALRPYHVVVVSQEVIGQYIADFCIYPARVVVEVDGPSHRGEKQVAYDGRRDSFMRNLGMRVFRFSNLEVESDTEAIAKIILSHCGNLELMSDHLTPIRIPEVQRREWIAPKRNVYESRYVRSGNGIRKRRSGALSSASSILSV
jgi:very-short-patch-repair endonuclease